MKARAVFVTVAMMLVAGACGADGDGEPGAAELTEVRIGVPLHDVWPVYVAETEGFFEEVGLDVEIFNFTSGAPLIAGLEGRSLDVIVTGLAVVPAISRGIELEFIMWEFDNTTTGGLNVDPDSGITDFSQLAKAKAIAAFPNTCSEVAATIAAEEAGLDYEELPIKEVEPSLHSAAFRAGDIDAGFAWSPHTFANDEAGFPLVNHGIEFNDVCPSTWSARPEFLEQHPNVALKLVEARALAMEAVEGNPQLAAFELAARLEVAPAIVERTLETGHWPTFEEQVDPDSRWSLDTRIGLAGQLHKAAEALFKAGALQESIPYETFADAVNPQYVEEFVTESQGGT